MGISKSRVGADFGRIRKVSRLGHTLEVELKAFVAVGIYKFEATPDGADFERIRKVSQCDTFLIRSKSAPAGRLRRWRGFRPNWEGVTM